MSCIYCGDNPQLSVNCYCRQIPPVSEMTSDQKAELDACAKIQQAVRDARKNNDQIRLHSLKTAVNGGWGGRYPTMIEIVKAFNL